MAESNWKLRHERQLRGWSQRDVAEQIEAPNDSYISRWERGEVWPSPFYQQRLCELFSKTAEELGLLQPSDEIPPPKISKVDERVIPSTIKNIPIPIETSVNPFTYGNPVSDPARFFGRTREIEHILSRLRNAEFESSSLVGERRTGKTSLLKYLVHPLIRQQYGFDPQRYLFIYVDLQIVDEQTTPTRLWQRLLRHIKNSCPDSHIQQMLEELTLTSNVDTFALDDVFYALDEHDYYVVLLLDEFEHVTENENFGAAFFYGLRSLAIHHHLALITSSRRELIELCHSQAIRSSPFFNIFANINMGLFIQNEALNLVNQLLTGTNIRFTDMEIEDILRTAGSHPYFLQMACSFLFNVYVKDISPHERLIALHNSFLEAAGPHLSFCWRASDDQEKTMLMALALLDRWRNVNASHFDVRPFHDISTSSNQTVSHLEKRGLVVFTANIYTLFNESFGVWIWNETTNTRQDQQNYQEWLMLNTVADCLKNFSDSDRKDVDTILSHINAEYRKILLHWLSEPRTFIVVAPLIKQLLPI